MVATSKQAVLETQAIVAVGCTSRAVHDAHARAAAFGQS